MRFATDFLNKFVLSTLVLAWVLVSAGGTTASAATTCTNGNIGIGGVVGLPSGTVQLTPLPARLPAAGGTWADAAVVVVFGYHSLNGEAFPTCQLRVTSSASWLSASARLVYAAPITPALGNQQLVFLLTISAASNSTLLGRSGQIAVDVTGADTNVGGTKFQVFSQAAGPVGTVPGGNPGGTGGGGAGPPAKSKAVLTVAPTSSSVEPTNVHRNNRKQSAVTLVATVKRDGTGVGSTLVQFGGVIDPSGVSGHDHLNAPPLSQGSCTTDGAGVCQVDLLAPEFSAYISITATTPNDDADPVSATVSVELTERLQSLVGTNCQIEPQGQYRLSGGTGCRASNSEHERNHFGTEDMLVQVQSLAALYRATHFDTLSINDLSLEHGGLFDIANDWTTKPGHVWHREGKSVDIDGKTVGGLSVDLVSLTFFARALGLFRAPESSIHYELGDAPASKGSFPKPVNVTYAPTVVP